MLATLPPSHVLLLIVSAREPEPGVYLIQPRQKELKKFSYGQIVGGLIFCAASLAAMNGI